MFTTIAIVILFIAVVVLFIAQGSNNSQISGDIRRAFDKANYAKSLGGQNAVELRERCNELASIIKQLAETQGLTLEVEKTVSFNLASILEGQPPKWSEKLKLVNAEKPSKKKKSR